MWDIKIREASKGKRNIGNFFRNLMTQTDSGIHKYTWIDIKASLQNTADIDWESFYQSYIKGDKPLPLDMILPLAGLHIIKLPDGSEQVVYDSTKSMEAKNLFHTLMGDWLKADK
jgi:predicted metalloprotease with PDZ domain